MTGRDAEREKAAKLIAQHGDAAYEFCRQQCIEADRARDGKALKHWTAVRVLVRLALAVAANSGEAASKESAAKNSSCS